MHRLVAYWVFSIWHQDTMEIIHAKSVIEVEQSITPHYYQWLVRKRFVTAPWWTQLFLLQIYNAKQKEQNDKRVETDFQVYKAFNLLSLSKDISLFVLCFGSVESVYCILRQKNYIYYAAKAPSTKALSERI